MKNKTELKEKRDSYLWLTLFTLFTIFVVSTIYSVGNNLITNDQTISYTFSFLGFFIIYRVLTFCFNFLLAEIVKKRWKINRLKGRVTPIYKLEEQYGEYSVIKYSAEYTELNLMWTIPFSVLFLEQEYIVQGAYKVGALKDVISLEDYYEDADKRNKLNQQAKNTAKNNKKQKIEILNKTFIENYK
jgi:hypothetical protein